MAKIDVTKLKVGQMLLKGYANDPDDSVNVKVIQIDASEEPGRILIEFKDGSRKWIWSDCNMTTDIDRVTVEMLADQEIHNARMIDKIKGLAESW